MTSLNHGYLSPIDEHLPCGKKENENSLDPVALSTDEYDKVHGRKKRSDTDVEFEAAFQPILDVGKIIGNTFSRYQNNEQVAKDIFLFLFGMKDLARGAVALPVASIIFPLILLSGFFWSIGIFFSNLFSKSERGVDPYKECNDVISKNLGKTSSTIIESLMLIDAGMTKIALSPLIFLRTIPKLLITCCTGWPTIEESKLIQSLIKSVKGWNKSQTLESTNHQVYDSKQMNLIMRTLRSKLKNGIEKNQATDIKEEKADLIYKKFRDNFKSDSVSAQKYFLKYCRLFSVSKEPVLIEENVSSKVIERYPSRNTVNSK